MPRVGINCYEFAPGRTGGTETYVRTLVRALEAVDRTNRYLVLLRQPLLEELRVECANFRKVGLPDRLTVPQRIVRKLGVVNRSWERTLATRIDGLGLEVVHFPLTTIFPFGVRARTVLSVMDIQQELLPGFFTAEERAARDARYRASAEAADHIIAISRFTKQTLCERYGVPTERISVVYPGYGHDLFAGEDERGAEDALPEPYLFYPAAAWPHKNHERLLEAFALVRRRHPDIRLVLTGMVVERTEALRRAIEELGLVDSVLSLGYVPYSRLGRLYRRAIALVFPSLFEGFGFPLLEAMAARCPIVASSAASIPEVADDAALYFDPLDAEEIARRIDEVVEAPELRAALADKGLARLRLFSLERMGRETVSVYEQLA